MQTNSQPSLSHFYHTHPNLDQFTILWWHKNTQIPLQYVRIMMMQEDANNMLILEYDDGDEDEEDDDEDEDENEDAGNWSNHIIFILKIVTMMMMSVRCKWGWSLFPALPAATPPGGQDRTTISSAQHHSLLNTHFLKHTFLKTLYCQSIKHTF